MLAHTHAKDRFQTPPRARGDRHPTAHYRWNNEHPYLLLSGEQGFHFFHAHVFRLFSVFVKGVNLHEDELCETNGDVLTPRPAGLIFIQYDDDLTVGVGVPANQFLLGCGQGAAHESHHLATAMLVQLHATEEPFDNDEWFLGRFLDGPIEVEQLQ